MVFGMLGILRYRKLLIIIPLLCILLLLSVTSVSERFLEIPLIFKDFDAKSTIFYPTTEAASFQWRLWFWHKTLDKALSDKSIFLHGFGIGNFSLFSEDFGIDLITNRGKGAHNDFLRLLVEVGVIGLLIYLWILLKVFKMGFGLYKVCEDKYLKGFLGSFLALFMAHIVVSLSSNIVSIPVFQWYFWSLVALMCSLHMRRETLRTGEAMI